MLKSVFCVALALAALLALTSRPVMADAEVGLPTYHYFYPCNSGVVDCANFNKYDDHKDYGDYGMNGIIVPANPPCSPDPGPCILPPTYGSFHVTDSNAYGEAVGWIEGIDRWFAYGHNGVVTWFNQDCPSPPVGINSDGLYLFNSLCGPDYGAMIGRNGEFSRLAFSVDPLLERSLGWPDFNGWSINDSDQILVAGGVGPHGVLSPGPIPEPSAVILLGTVVCGCVLALRKRQTVARRNSNGTDASLSA